jgi:twitching motility protein PilT
MQIGQAKHGMQTLNQSLFSLYTRRMITLEEAMGRSNDVDELRNMIEGRGGASGPGNPGVQGSLPPR